MPFNATAFDRHLAKAIGDIAQTIRLVSGATVAACVTTGGEANALDIEGVTDSRQLTAIVRVAVCDVLPVANDVIGFGGQNYRVSDVAMHDDGLAVTIHATGEWQ